MKYYAEKKYRASAGTAYAIQQEILDAHPCIVGFGFGLRKEELVAYISVDENTLEAHKIPRQVNGIPIRVTYTGNLPIIFTFSRSFYCLVSYHIRCGWTSCGWTLSQTVTRYISSSYHYDHSGYSKYHRYCLRPLFFWNT